MMTIPLFSKSCHFDNLQIRDENGFNKRRCKCYIVRCCNTSHLKCHWMGRTNFPMLAEVLRSSILNLVLRRITKNIIQLSCNR